MIIYFWSKKESGDEVHIWRNGFVIMMATKAGEVKLVTGNVVSWGGAILTAMFAKQHYYSLKADEHCSLKNQPAAALVRAVS